MIDHELSRLTGALRAAEDTLNSPDFGAQQARLVALEQEAKDAEQDHARRIEQLKAELAAEAARLKADHEALAAELEGKEGIYEDAQRALTAYIAAEYLEGVERSDEELFEPDPPFVPALGSGPESSAMPFNMLDDEYASAKSNGALTD